MFKKTSNFFRFVELFTSYEEENRSDEKKFQKQLIKNIETSYLLERKKFPAVARVDKCCSESEAECDYWMWASIRFTSRFTQSLHVLYHSRILAQRDIKKYWCCDELKQLTNISDIIRHYELRHIKVEYICQLCLVCTFDTPEKAKEHGKNCNG